MPTYYGDDYHNWQKNSDPRDARIAALEAELAETKYAYCHRPRKQRCGNPDICSACQPFEGQIKALRVELTLALSQRDEARTQLSAVVKAWESLPGPREYTQREVQTWMNNSMAPAINQARAAIENLTKEHG